MAFFCENICIYKIFVLSLQTKLLFKSIFMAHIALVKPEWLEIISCCSPKVQMDLIRAIVAWQTDGTMPDFRGVKKALFLMLVRDLAEKSTVPVDEIDAPEASSVTAQESADADIDVDAAENEDYAPEKAIPTPPEETTTEKSVPSPTPTDSTTVPRRHGGRSSFSPYRRLY